MVGAQSSFGFGENANDCSLEQIQFSQVSIRRNFIAKLIKNAISHALEALLAALISPITILHWLSKHDHFVIFLRVLIEVFLELMLMMVLGTVSIITAAALIFDDALTNNLSDSLEMQTDVQTTRGDY